MKILVKTPSGKSFEFKVKFKDTIQSIKEKIEYKEDIPLEDQRLVFGGKELEDYRIIGEYNIQDNQTINLLIKLKSINKIIVKDLNEKEINLDTNSSDTIKNIKEKIKDKEGILPNQYKLVLDGKQLEEDKTVEFYNIKNDSNVQLVPLDVFQICIHKTYGEKIIIDVNNFDTIKNIKKKIENQEGIPIEKQVLLFNGEKLKDINIIYLNKIQKDSVILLTLRNMIKIFVKTINGNTITLNVKPSDTIKEIKEQIKNKLVIPFYRHKLLFNGEILDEYKSLLFYNIENESTLILDPNDIIQIFVNNIEGKKIIIHVKQYDTIKDIKEKIKSKERINENEYRLLFDQKILEDYKTLEYYNINNKSIIYLKYYNNFQIFIKSWYNKSFILDANGSVTIEIIKEKLKDKEGILPNQYKLVLDGKQLEEYKSLEDFKITEDSTIYLIECKLIPIFVRTWVGTTFTLNIAESDKILDIKKYIEYKIGIYSDQQRLTFEGKPLEDNKILGQYNIQGSSLDLIFHLTLRLRGGH